MNTQPIILDKSIAIIIQRKHSDPKLNVIVDGCDTINKNPVKQNIRNNNLVKVSI